MQRNGCGVRYIKTGKWTRGRNVAEPVASVSCQLAQALALGAEYEGKRKSEFRGLERLGTFFGEPDPQKSGFA